MNQLFLKLVLFGSTICTCIFSWEYDWSIIIVLSTGAGVLHEYSVYNQCIESNMSWQEAFLCKKINRIALWSNLITMGLFLFFGFKYIKERNKWEMLYVASIVFLVYTFTYVFSRILAYSRYQSHLR